MTMQHRIRFYLIWLLLLPVTMLFAQSNLTFDQYHNSGEVVRILKEMHRTRPDDTRLHEIAVSPGGEPLIILEIGSNQDDCPAVFAGANFEGNYPLVTEGALMLAKMVLDSSKYSSGLKWYILPAPNPDAAKGFFSKIKYNRTVNDITINDDVDENENEDGFDDLNGDGYITQMRVKSYEGTYIQSDEDSRLMVRADVKRYERGLYKIYTEGLDNDNDGKYNEDGEGGINPGIAFPHLFPFNRKDAGLYSGQTPEVYGIMRFIFDHPEIAMVYTLGSSDFCLFPPEGGRKGDAQLDKIKIPSHYARMMGADPSAAYPMDEVIELLKEHMPEDADLTPSAVAGMLGLGQAVNPLDDDLAFYKKLNDEYKKYLDGKKFNYENIEPVPAKDGSFELWAYYHLGLPSFSMNLFSVPAIKDDSVKTDVRSANAKKEADREADGNLNKKEKALLAWSDKEWDKEGFVEWEKFDHPDLGEVEIGGFKPYLETTPKVSSAEPLLKTHIPWLLQLTGKMPHIFVADNKITSHGAGVYKLELYIENRGFLPYPVSMGQRNSQPAPVVVVLEGDFELLEGLKRTPAGAIGGNQVKKMTWMLKAGKKTELTVKVESSIFGDTDERIMIGGGS